MYLFKTSLSISLELEMGYAGNEHICYTMSAITERRLLWQQHNPDSRVHGANMGHIWGRQDPCWPHVGPMNFAIWEHTLTAGERG